MLGQLTSCSKNPLKEFIKCVGSTPVFAEEAMVVCCTELMQESTNLNSKNKMVFGGL